MRNLFLLTGEASAARECGLFRFAPSQHRGEIKAPVTQFCRINTGREGAASCDQRADLTALGGPREPGTPGASVIGTFRTSIGSSSKWWRSLPGQPTLSSLDPTDPKTRRDGGIRLRKTPPSTSRSSGWASPSGEGVERQLAPGALQIRHPDKAGWWRSSRSGRLRLSGTGG